MNHAASSAPPDHAFTWQAPVYFDDLDAMGMLHNAHYPVLLDRTITAFFESHGRVWTPDPADNPDQHWAVRQQTFEYSLPYRGVGTLGIALWVASLGRTSATYGVEYRSGHGVHVRGARTVVKFDPVSHRPSPWTEQTRSQLVGIAAERPLLDEESPHPPAAETSATVAQERA